ncbi:hypothetical protein ILUMI_00071 [Ignelater luminosus]|uniref:Uncharacterized protein n=1 Tax=Ignelater luminosus TaxID=2038154 RepID=A0A8K0DTB3_IGNLU|nr:hypothetical protein ILUMI_00071 [Ignelater luminosus]
MSNAEKYTDENSSTKWTRKKKKKVYMTQMFRKCFRRFEKESSLHVQLFNNKEQDGFLSGLISFHASTRRCSRRRNEQGKSEGESSNDNLIANSFVNNAVFTNKFNIALGLPRSDTCSVCDRLTLQINAAEDAETKQKLIATKDLYLENGPGQEYAETDDGDNSRDAEDL